MKKLVLAMFTLTIITAGCGHYSGEGVAMTEPKNMSYCERIGDMAVGMEPYMVKDKTNLVFDYDLIDEEIMALNVSMIADGGTKYVVRKADIEAVDEDGIEYKPISAAEVGGRIDRALRADAGLMDDLEAWELKDETTVSNELSQGFLYYDMGPSDALARQLTVYLTATSEDGSAQKAFRLTVDPYRAHMNPSERWDIYDGRGVAPDLCGMAAKKEAPKPAMKEEVKEAPKPAPSKEAEKAEKRFEEKMMK